MRALPSTSHLIRGAWIEISVAFSDSLTSYRRISYEVRGLKFLHRQRRNESVKSHLIRGAWIEIFFLPCFDPYFSCRISYEVRGLKYRGSCLLNHGSQSRISYEVRGLKYPNRHLNNDSLLVASHTRCVD